MTTQTTQCFGRDPYSLVIHHQYGKDVVSKLLEIDFSVPPLPDAENDGAINEGNVNGEDGEDGVDDNGMNGHDENNNIDNNAEKNNNDEDNEESDHTDNTLLVKSIKKAFDLSESSAETIPDHILGCCTNVEDVFLRVRHFLGATEEERDAEIRYGTTLAPAVKALHRVNIAMIREQHAILKASEARFQQMQEAAETSAAAAAAAAAAVHGKHPIPIAPMPMQQAQQTYPVHPNPNPYGVPNHQYARYHQYWQYRNKQMWSQYWHLQQQQRLFQQQQQLQQQHHYQQQQQQQQQQQPSTENSSTSSSIASDPDDSGDDDWDPNEGKSRSQPKRSSSKASASAAAATTPDAAPATAVTPHTVGDPEERPTKDDQTGLRTTRSATRRLWRSQASTRGPPKNVKTKSKTKQPSKRTKSSETTSKSSPIRRQRSVGLPVVSTLSPPDDDLKMGDWPSGWTKIARQRNRGKTTGRLDFYWISPLRRYPFRSLAEVRRFLLALEVSDGDEATARAQMEFFREQEVLLRKRHREKTSGKSSVQIRRGGRAKAAAS